MHFEAIRHLGLAKSLPAGGYLDADATATAA